MGVGVYVKSTEEVDDLRHFRTLCLHSKFAPSITNDDRFAMVMS